MTHSLEPRPSWDSVWMQTAEAIAKRSKCSRARVGAVIVASDQTVISCSYNGPAPDFIDANTDSCSDWCPRAKVGASLDSSYANCVACHSEANAISRANWSQTVGATAFITSAVCINCAKLLAAARVKRIVHAVSATDTHRSPDEVETFLKKCGIEVVRWNYDNV